MAKFLKTIFSSSSERKRSSKCSDKGLDDDGRNDFSVPGDDRRKLSISRSGRMKQNNKKRAQLSSEVFGEELQVQHKPTTIEYHVHRKKPQVDQQQPQEVSKTKDNVDITEGSTEGNNNARSSLTLTTNLQDERRKSQDLTPEEAQIEIDNAFKILNTAV